MTFTTPFGRWRYTRAPQGYLSTEDGYNRHFDEIIANFQLTERYIDDTIHWDVERLNHWWRTIEYFILVGRAGVVLYPDKFQFAQRTVDFAGFRISMLRLSHSRNKVARNVVWAVAIAAHKDAGAVCQSGRHKRRFGVKRDGRHRCQVANCLAESRMDRVASCVSCPRERNLRNRQWRSVYQLC